MQFEELYYGVVYDLWFTYGSMHEAKAYRVRKAKSAWLRSGITLLAYLYGYAIAYSFFRGWL